MNILKNYLKYLLLSFSIITDCFAGKVSLNFDIREAATIFNIMD